LVEALIRRGRFAWHARQISAFLALQEICPHEPRRGEGVRAFRRRGEDLCRRIYGALYGRMTAKMRSYHPDLALWLLTDGYGKVLSRPTLTPRERELLILPFLAAMNVPLQLRSRI